jgi:hypothetical protein
MIWIIDLNFIVFNVEISKNNEKITQNEVRLNKDHIKFWGPKADDWAKRVNKITRTFTKTVEFMLITIYVRTKMKEKHLILEGNAVL